MGRSKKKGWLGESRIMAQHPDGPHPVRRPRRRQPRGRSDSPGRQPPDLSDSPGRQPPGRSDSPGRQPPDLSDSPGRQPPGRSDSPGRQPPDLSDSPRRQPPDRSDSPGFQPRDLSDSRHRPVHPTQQSSSLVSRIKDDILMSVQRQLEMAVIRARPTKGRSHPDTKKSLSLLAHHAYGPFIRRPHPVDVDDNALCTVLCDILADLPKRTNPRNLFKLRAMLKKCYADDSYKDTKDISHFDLRGRSAEDAIMFFKEQLNIGLTCTIKGIVGCKVHGVGEGKLKQAILDDLNGDNDIDYRCENGGCVISVTLTRSGKDFSGVVDELGIAGPAALKMLDTREEVPSVSLACKDLRMCTFACDHLFRGIGKQPNQIYDDKMSKRVLRGFEKCYIDDSDNCIEGTNRLDLRGWLMMEAIEKLVEHLNQWSIKTPQGCLDVVVGCKLHGVGEGTLKEKIKAVLTAVKTIDFKFTHDWMITISFNGQKDYSFLIEVADGIFRHLYGFDIDVCGGYIYGDLDDYDGDLIEILAELEAEIKAKNEEEASMMEYNKGFIEVLEEMGW